MQFEYGGRTYKKVALLGLGNHYINFRVQVSKYIQFAYYADNNKEKQRDNAIGDGIKCIAPEKMIENGVDFVVIGPHGWEIKRKLKEQVHGLGIDHCFLDDIILDVLDNDAKEQRKERGLRTESFFEGKEGRERIILLNTPQISSTIGDHAISVAERILLKRWFPNKQIIEIGDRFLWECRDEISEYIYPSDILLIQGGGYLGSLWRPYREDTIRYILQKYPQNRIIVLPQTMYFEDTPEGHSQMMISKEIYNSHKHLTVCFREKKSYDLGSVILSSHVKKFLIPDPVTSMKLNEKVEKTNKVAICFKNDKETIFGRKLQDQLEAFLRQRGYDVCHTTMFYSNPLQTEEERQEVIFNKMRELASYKLFITDAMHGMVLATVSGTACLAIESVTGKVGGVFEWIKGNQYVKYADAIEKVESMVEGLLKINECVYDDSVIQKEIEKLKDIILYANAV